MLEPDSLLSRAEERRSDQDPYHLDNARGAQVLAGIQQACERRAWKLLAAHVRTDHVHAVVSADADPQAVFVSLKAYASRQLNQSGFETADRKRWSRHASTVYLWNSNAVEAAIRYVVEGQGAPMNLVVSASATQGELGGDPSLRSALPRFGQGSD